MWEHQEVKILAVYSAYRVSFILRAVLGSYFSKISAMMNIHGKMKLTAVTTACACNVTICSDSVVVVGMNHSLGRIVET